MDKLELKETNPMASKKFPLPNVDHTFAIVKFYNEMAETVRVGQWIEIIGIRGQNLPSNEQTGFDSTLDLFANVPVVHAIAFNSIQPESVLPINPNVRDSLIDYIASVTKDRLTAEFILLQLLSRVYSIISFILFFSSYSSIIYVELSRIEDSKLVTSL